MSDVESVKLIEREALERMYLRGNKSRRRNMEIWDFVKGKCGQPSFFLEMEASGDPEEFAFEEMQREMGL